MSARSLASARRAPPAPLAGSAPLNASLDPPALGRSSLPEARARIRAGADRALGRQIVGRRRRRHEVEVAARGSGDRGARARRGARAGAWARRAPTRRRGVEPRPIKVGLVIPQSGVYAPLGEDMKAGWDLWLEQHGNKLGGREVETVVVDEGEGPDTGVPAVQKVLQQDRVDTVVGIVNSATALGCGRGRRRGQEGAGRRQRRRRPPDRVEQVHLAHVVHERPGRLRRRQAPRGDARGQEGRVRDGRRLRRRRGGDRGLQEGLRGGRRQGRGRGEDAVRDDAGLPAVPGEGAQRGRRAPCTCSTRAPRPCRSSSSTRSSASPTAPRCTAPGSSPRAAC